MISEVKKTEKERGKVSKIKPSRHMAELPKRKPKRDLGRIGVFVSGGTNADRKQTSRPEQQMWPLFHSFHTNNSEWNNARTAPSEPKQ